MLLSFSVQNFKSIRDLQTLDLRAGKDDHLHWSNLTEKNGHQAVKVAAIYGANASGKSNVLEALFWFKHFVLHWSIQGQASDRLRTKPFRLRKVCLEEPTKFEILFLLAEQQYRYGYEVTAEAVKSEWLYRKGATGKELKLFTRDGQQIEVSPSRFKQGKGLDERTRKNSLFLSVCALFDVKEAGSILDWMNRLRDVEDVSEESLYLLTAEGLSDPAVNQAISTLIQSADFSIAEIKSRETEVNEKSLPISVIKRLEQLGVERDQVLVAVKTIHTSYDSDGNSEGELEFDLENDESEGTKKFFALSGPILHALSEGSILIIDELDARLHPHLTQSIVDLFHSPLNAKGAQLIITTHDVTLLDSDRFRRDQVWFCEKDKQGATDLFCLADFDSSTVRSNSKFSRQYLLGLFGAIPNLSEFQQSTQTAVNTANQDATP